MATKIRLQRGGHKGYAVYRIVVADSRAPRDGRFTEKLGTYNPNTNPATVDLNFDRALYWVEVGAQPTDTARNILKSEGVYMMKHLRGGVKKGAFDEAAAQSMPFVRVWLRLRKRLLPRLSRLRRRSTRLLPRRWLTRKLRLLPLLLRLRLLPLRTLLPRHKSFGKVDKQTLPFIRIKSDRLVNKLVGLFFVPVAHLQTGQRAMGRGREDNR